MIGWQYPLEVMFWYIGSVYYITTGDKSNSFGNKMIEFFSQLPIKKLMKYKIRYDVRYKKINGEYARILYQEVMIQHDDKGRLLKTLSLFRAGSAKIISLSTYCI